MPPLRRSSLLMLGSVEPNLPRPFGSSRRGPHSLSPFRAPALAFGSCRVCLAKQGSEFFQQPTSFILIGCALQLLSQSIESCSDFFERSLSDHREIGNVEDVRISSIGGYLTSCTTFVPLLSPMNISCFDCVFAPNFDLSTTMRRYIKTKRSALAEGIQLLDERLEKRGQTKGKRN